MAESRIITIQKELVEPFRPSKVMLLKDKSTGVTRQVECLGKAMRYWICRGRWDYECYEFEKWDEVPFDS